MTDIKDLYAKNEPQGGGGLFLKTESGKTYTLRVLDLPVVFDSEYDGKISTKFAWPVYNHDSKEVQILQKGASVYKGLNSLIQDDDWGDPVEYDIKLTHTGNGIDTEYSVSPARNSKDVPTDIELPDVASVIASSPSASKVHKLGELVKSDDVVLEDIDETIEIDDIPFK